MPRLRRRFQSTGLRDGLTLIEVVVVVAIVLILVASLTPSLLGVLDRKRVDSASESLDALVAGMSAMRADNQDWPSRLTHLVVPITTSDRNICGANYASGKVSNWGGPYLSRTLSASGFPIGIGIARDSLIRELISGNDAYLKVQIDDVTEEDALELDKIYDQDGSAAGSVRWGAASTTGQVTLFFLRPIRGC